MSKKIFKYLILAVLILVGVGAFIWIRTFVFDRLGTALDARIQSLNLSGFNVHYDSLSVNWRTSVIEINNLVLEKNAYDTTCVYPEFIAIARVRAKGVGLFQLIFRRKLTLETVQLDEGRIVMRQNSMMKLDSATKRKNEFALQVDRILVNSVDFVYTDSIQCEVITGFKSRLSVKGLTMDFHVDAPFEYAAESITLDSAEIRMPGDFYTFRILQARMNFSDREFSADTIKILPDVGKAEFGRKYGFEVDRIEGIVPFIKTENFTFSFSDTGFVNASSARIQFYLKVFRDKRLPFVRKEKLLPVAQLRNLPFQLAIDSLKVIKSYVQYEEFAEGASEAGRIFFDDMYAVFHNVTNLPGTGSMQMSARASLMGHGKLDVFANFPLSKNKRAAVRGSITNFPIPEINSMLTPSTQIKVESGQMKDLSFNFTFNQSRSDGEVELNYENLKLISFKDEEKTSGDKPEKDNVKTFIMNTFVFRKNMDEDVPDDKRKGTIAYVRDNSRSIFNFWSKSLVSGLKSAYNLDKVEAKKSERESKKGERLARKEAKKVKRAEKKKDRG